MSAGAFLEGLADGAMTARKMKRQRSITDALDRMNGDSGGGKQVGAGGDASHVPKNTAAGSGTVSEGQRRGSGRGEYASEFNSRLAQSESGGRYGVVNDEGYTGKYQFGQARLDDYNRSTGGDYTTAQLRDAPDLQENVQAWHVRDIDSFVSDRGLDKYIGQEVGGVPITRDGLRAMAHLGGKGGMEKFVTTGGRYNPADSNGTALSDYGRKFAGAPAGAKGTGGGKRRTSAPAKDKERAPFAERAARSIFGDESPAQKIVRMFYKES